MRRLTPFLVLTSLAACGPDGRDNTGTPDATVGADSGDAPPATDQSRVYAHSGRMLYQVDTMTLEANPIATLTGGFVGMEGLTDLAVDNADHMVGISFDNLFTVNPTTGVVTLVGPLEIGGTNAGFSSLSYVPVVGGDQLVSANDEGDIYSISATGVTAKIGNFGMRGADPIVSSGDLFGVSGFGVYATVKIGTDANDYLVKVNPDDGWKATVPANNTGFQNIFGLGFWAGKIYGFVDQGFDAGTGKIVEIDPVTGVGTEVLPGNIRWFGAGVATDAPILQ